MTIKEAVSAAADRLKRARVENHRLESESLLSYALKKDLAWLLAHAEDALPAAKAKAYAGMVASRARRVPFAYVVGEKGFYGRVFRVSPAVLVPRPSTETLIEAALAGLPADRPLTIVDVGTGSGAIGLTLLAERPQAKAVLYDISKKALAVARANARRLKLSRRARLAKLDILKQALPEPKGEVALVANLPYLPTAQWRHAWPEVRGYEPKLALVSGKDGLDHYRALFRKLARWKRPPRLLALEAEPGQFETLARLTRQALPDAAIGILQDLHGDERVLVAENQNAP